jgi:hypothetical protein
MAWTTLCAASVGRRGWMSCATRQAFSKSMAAPVSSLLSSRLLTTNATTAVNDVDVERFQKLGYLNEQGLTQFDTLHEMQVRSCQVYAPNPLFGSYSESSKAFEWMTFAQFDTQVQKCRTLLKDLGESFVNVFRPLEVYSYL